MVSENITPSRDSDNEQDLAFIRDSPNELILYIYELLPENFVLDFWFPPVPKLNVFLRMQHLSMPPSLKRWLLERVFVCSPKTKYVLPEFMVTPISRRIRSTQSMWPRLVWGSHHGGDILEVLQNVPSTWRNASKPWPFPFAFAPSWMYTFIN